VLMRSQGFRSEARAPNSPFPPLATLLGEKAKTVHLLSLLYYSILTLNRINVLT